MTNKDVKNCIDNSILCWLATSNSQNEPNVSPKEIFTLKDDSTLLIANIASPQSSCNIKENPNVCVSILEIFIQKGFKIKGIANLIDQQDVRFKSYLNLLTDLFSDKFPIITIIEVKITSVETIKAPSYFLFPEITEQAQIESTMKTYKVKSAE